MQTTQSFHSKTLLFLFTISLVALSLLLFVLSSALSCYVLIPKLSTFALQKLLRRLSPICRFTYFNVFGLSLPLAVAVSLTTTTSITMEGVEI